MDPNIMKLLEEDEDETMHSGADVEAFQAALNRDIGGDVSTSQPSDSSSVLSHENNQSSSQQFPNWPTVGQNDNASNTEEHDAKSVEQQHHQEQQSSAMETKQHVPNADNQQQKGDVLQEPTHPPVLQKKNQDDIKQELVEQAPVQTPQSIGAQSSEQNPTPKSEPDKMQISDVDSQFLNFQKIGNQQTTGTDQAANQKNSKQIPFVLLLPALKPHLDKDREMQLQTLFNKLRKNEIAKDQFVRLMRNIVGDQVLRLAVAQLQSQSGSNQSQLQSQAGRQNNVRMPAGISATQFPDPHHLLHPRGSISSEPSRNPPSAVQLQTDSSIVNSQKSKAVEWQADSLGIQASQLHSSSTSIVNQERERPSISMQGQNKQQQHVHFPPTSFPMYGSSGGNYNPYPGTKVSTSGPSVKPQPHDQQTRQISHHQNMGGTQVGGPPHNMISMPKFERQNSANDSSRVHSGSVSHYTNKSAVQQNSVPWQAPPNREQSPAPFSSMNYVKPGSLEQAGEQQNKPQLLSPQVLPPAPEQGNAISGNLKDQSLDKQSSKVVFSTSTGMVPPSSVSPSIVTQLDPNGQVSSRNPSVASPAGVSARTPPKKPSVGQKKPFEALGSSPPASSKKQKVAGAFSDQSIEQLNDVTAVSGVNLREEEEQLFSGTKEDSRVSEASRRVVQEEEERLILQKIPLQKKLGEIMAKCGLKNIGNDVGRCLSLCVEERMRGLISNLIRLSKQRVDAEKPRHQTLITSDVRQQIMAMSRKAREEWEKRQAEAEKLQKVNDPEGENGGEGDKEKDEGRVKSVKANKEEDDKMRTTAANVAARAAVGGADMLSKWQLMAEQARQKREVGMEGASSSQPVKDVNRNPQSPSGRNVKENLEAEKRSPAVPPSASGAVRKFGRNQAIAPQTKVVRTITVKDVMAVLEREPQMSRSTLIYQLYERIRSEAAPE
ncbi:PREDICTED: transcription initiation factor TFIID subunit 4b [Populus euphratica]|uniref:Transcription initiation factor TFIID subunit 4b n=1 Tax=Populus euphratica TaxID=75702 RepID=A0AAJ6TT63_POPEU|nr:PREDICTED: transcription initiation factor TFIID subunit 4b [Populus euphratica]